LSEYLGKLFTGVTDYTGLTMAILISSLAFASGEIPRAVLRSQKRIKTLAWLDVFFVSIYLSSTVLLVIGLKLGMTGFVSAFFIARFSFLTASIYCIRTLIRLKFSLPLA